MRRALSSLVRALRNLHDEQVYAWECFVRSCRAPQPCTRAAAPGGGSHTTADSMPAPPVGAHSSDLAA